MKYRASAVKGVFQNESKTKWKVYIQSKYKKINCGVFYNFNDAVRSRYHAEQYLGWSKNTPAYKYMKKNKLFF